MNPNGRKQQSTEHERLRSDGSSIQLMCTSTGRHEGCWKRMGVLISPMGQKFFSSRTEQASNNVHPIHGSSDPWHEGTSTGRHEGTLGDAGRRTKHCMFIDEPALQCREPRAAQSPEMQDDGCGNLNRTHEGTLGDAWRRVGKIHEGMKAFGNAWGC